MWHFILDLIIAPDELLKPVAFSGVLRLNLPSLFIILPSWE